MASPTSTTSITPAVNSPYAYVTFVMCGDTYVLAALVLAYSLRAQKTTADIVCLITADVSKPAETALKALFTKVIKVPYLSGSPEKCTWISGKRFGDMYKSWIHKSFTRFQALRLEGYEKICVIDADALCLNNPDEIFLLDPPAAIVSRIDDRGYKFKHRHGERIDQKEVGPKQRQCGASCGILLLKPDAEDYRAMVAQVRNHGGFGDPKCHWGPDEQLVTQHYNRKCGWTNISRKFWCTAWRQEDLQEVQVDVSEVERGQSLNDSPVAERQQGDEDTAVGAENVEQAGSSRSLEGGEGGSTATASRETISVQEKARFIHYVSEKPWRSSEAWPDMVQWRETAKLVLKSIHVDESEGWVVQGWNQ